MANSTGLNAVEGLVSAFAAAWNAHDAHAFAAIFCDDVDFTNVFGVRAAGRAAVERSHAVIFATIFRDSVLVLQEPRMYLLRPDLASIDVHWEMTGATDPAGTATARRYGMWNAIATMTSDGWSFAVFHNQDLPPPARVAEIEHRIAALVDARGP